MNPIAKQFLLFNLLVLCLAVSSSSDCQILNPYLEFKAGRNDLSYIQTSVGGQVYRPGFSYAFGAGILMRWNNHISYHVHAQRYALGFTLEDEANPEWSGSWFNYAFKTAFGVQFNWRRFTLEPSFEYNRVYKNHIWGYEEVANRNYWQYSVTIGYKASRKYHIEPYLQLNRGISAVHNCRLGPFNIRRHYSREMLFGFKIYLLQDKQPIASDVSKMSALKDRKRKQKTRSVIPFGEIASGLNWVRAAGKIKYNSEKQQSPFEFYEPTFSFTLTTGLAIKLSPKIALTPSIGYQYRSVNIVEPDTFGLFKYGSLQTGIGFQIRINKMYVEPAYSYNFIQHKSNVQPFEKDVTYHDGGQVSLTIGGLELNKTRIDPFIRITNGLQATNRIMLNWDNKPRVLYPRELMIGVRYRISDYTKTVHKKRK